MRPRTIHPPEYTLRSRSMHKGQAGRLVVVGGSAGMSGAPRLVAAGALACGAGLVHVMVPAPVRAEVTCEDPAFLVTGLPATAGGSVSWTAAGHIFRRAEREHALVLGPGLGEHPETAALARRLVQELELPVVVDADALNALAGHELPEAAGARVFTPHPGEAARLLECTVAEVQKDRNGACAELRRRLGGVVVLKGAGTLVFNGARLMINPTGNPGLAVGGTGDVLAGMIGGLLVQGLAPTDAACDAVYLHGEAADVLAEEECGQRGLTPLDLLGIVPRVIAAREHPPRRRR